MAGEATPDGNPFRAYPWFPIPDALTREQPDGALAGPPVSFRRRMRCSAMPTMTRLGAALERGAFLTKSNSSHWIASA